MKDRIKKANLAIKQFNDLTTYFTKDEKVELYSSLLDEVIYGILCDLDLDRTDFNLKVLHESFKNNGRLTCRVVNALDGGDCCECCGCDEEREWKDVDPFDNLLPGINSINSAIVVNRNSFDDARDKEFIEQLNKAIIERLGVSEKYW